MPAGVSAWKALANVTLGSTASTVTFSSISQSYRDLVIVASPIVADGTSNAGLRIQFNGDTTATYARLMMYGENGSYGSNAAVDSSVIGGAVHPVATNTIYNIMDYSATDKHKVVLVRSAYPGSSSPGTVGVTVRWGNTAAITTMVLFPTASSFAAGSTFTLYGVS